MMEIITKFLDGTLPRLYEQFENILSKPDGAMSFWYSSSISFACVESYCQFLDEEMVDYSVGG